MVNMNKNKSVSYEKQIVYTINLCYTKINRHAPEDGAFGIPELTPPVRRQAIRAITEKAIERG